jgi:hypothetical protein
MSWSALRAKPAENKLAFAKNTSSQRAGGRGRDAIPLNVLHLAAPVAEEVVMPYPFRIVSRGAPLEGHLTHQTRLY